MTGSPSLTLNQLERFYSYASAVARESDTAIILSDLEGRQLINTRVPFGKPLPMMLPMEREFRARYGNEPTLISDLYTPPAGLGPKSASPATIRSPIDRAERRVTTYSRVR